MQRLYVTCGLASRRTRKAAYVVNSTDTLPVKPSAHFWRVAKIRISITQKLPSSKCINTSSSFVLAAVNGSRWATESRKQARSAPDVLGAGIVTNLVTTWVGAVSAAALKQWSGAPSHPVMIKAG